MGKEDKNTPKQKEHFAKVGERIRELRILQGLSIKGIEELLELPSGTIHHLEHGNGGTGISLLALVAYFGSQGYSLKWILDFDNEEHFKKDEQHLYIDIDKSQLIDMSEELTEFAKKFAKTVDKYK